MKKTVFILLVCAFAFSQNANEIEFDYYGIQAITGKHTFDDREMIYSGVLFSSLFRYQESYLGYLGIGVGNLEIPAVDSQQTDLVSKTTILGQLQFIRPYKLMYLEAGVRYFNIRGDVEVDIDGNTYSQENNYSLVQIPFGMGAYRNFNQVSIMAGLRKVYYFGWHNYQKFVDSGSGPVQVNDEKKTFSELGPLYFVADAAYQLMENYYLGLNLAFNSSSDYTVSITVGVKVNYFKL